MAPVARGDRTAPLPPCGLRPRSARSPWSHARSLRRTIPASQADLRCKGPRAPAAAPCAGAGCRGKAPQALPGGILSAFPASKQVETGPGSPGLGEKGERVAVLPGRRSQRAGCTSGENDGKRIRCGPGDAPPLPVVTRRGDAGWIGLAEDAPSYPEPSGVRGVSAGKGAPCLACMIRDRGRESLREWPNPISQNHETKACP